MPLSTWLCPQRAWRGRALGGAVDPLPTKDAATAFLRVRVEVHLGLCFRAAPTAFRWAGSEHDRNAETACLMGVALVPLVMPWGYALKHYLRAPGDRWGKQVTVRPPLPSDKPKTYQH